MKVVWSRPAPHPNSPRYATFGGSLGSTTRGICAHVASHLLGRGSPTWRSSPCRPRLWRQTRRGPQVLSQSSGRLPTPRPRRDQTRARLAKGDVDHGVGEDVVHTNVGQNAFRMTTIATLAASARSYATSGTRQTDVVTISSGWIPPTAPTASKHPPLPPSSPLARPAPIPLQIQWFPPSNKVPFGLER